jgi:hypothetical protein
VVVTGAQPANMVRHPMSTSGAMNLAEITIFVSSIG